VLFDRPNWPQHRPWLVGFVIVTLASVTWFLVVGFDSAQWPGGSSVPGFTFGIAGGLIIIFEFLLWLRRKVRTWRIGSAQIWLRAHIWLGLLCLPLLILHSGLRLGGTLSTILMVLLVLVIASGIWGLILQNLLPRRMLDGMPADTVYSQKSYLVLQLVAAADELVSVTCGVKPETTAATADDAGPVIVGTTPFLGPRVPATLVAEAEPLAVFYREQVAPFLRDGSATDSPLASASQAAVVFRNFKKQIPPAAHEIVEALERFCQQRRLWDRQARLHFWLHNWIWVHYPLSVALIVLMAVHVLVALRFW
jgi:hypothetical protein